MGNVHNPLKNYFLSENFIPCKLRGKEDIGIAIQKPPPPKSHIASICLWSGISSRATGTVCSQLLAVSFQGLAVKFLALTDNHNTWRFISQWLSVVLTRTMCGYSKSSIKGLQVTWTLLTMTNWIKHKGIFVLLFIYAFFPHLLICHSSPHFHHHILSLLISFIPRQGSAL